LPSVRRCGGYPAKFFKGLYERGEVTGYRPEGRKRVKLSAVSVRAYFERTRVESAQPERRLTIKEQAALSPRVIAARAARVNEETVKYYAEMELDFECPHCGEMTPRPRQTTDKSPMGCLWCGELLAVACGNCSTLETRRDALFCRVCREPLNWDAVKIRESLNKATETERDRLDRIDKEKETRRRERKKTGEPEL